MNQFGLLLAAAVACAPSILHATVVFERNERNLLVTHVGEGFGGADESRLQTVSFGMTGIGFGAQISFQNSVADDVRFAAPTTINKLTFYSYQTNSTTTSTFTQMHVQLWNGPPNAGGTVVRGDLTTNVLDTGAVLFSNIYRTTETTIGNATRPIMIVPTVALNWAELPAGTYWIQVRYAGQLASGPWQPPVTILGQASPAGANALQFIFDTNIMTGTWNVLRDGGPGVPIQAVPISISGTQPDNADLFVSIDDSIGAVLESNTVEHEILLANPGPSAVPSVRLQLSASNYSPLSWTCQVVSGGGACPAATGSGELDVLVDLPVNSSYRFTSLATVTGVAGMTAIRSAALTHSSPVLETDPSNNTDSDSNPIVGDFLFDDGFEGAGVIPANVRALFPDH